MQQNLSQEVLGRRCIRCNLVKPLTDYYYVPQKEGFGHCKKCTTLYQKIAERDALVRPKPINCECCGKFIPNNKPCYDHDHETGQFRGWLCYSCNTGLGKLGDNIEGLEKAIEYLKRFNETTN